MKTAHEIAQVLLNRRNAMNPVVMQGEMINALTAEGLQEALQRRWLVPDQSNGYLLVSQDMSKVLEMRELAEECGKCPEDLAKEKKEKDGEKKEEEWTKPWEKPNESRAYSMQHSHRPLSELLSPATGHDSGGALTNTPASTSRFPGLSASSTPTTPPARPAAPAQSIQPAGTNKAGVGDDVMVVGKGAGTSEAQTFTNKITSAGGGKVKINFGGRDEREYPENEVQLIQKPAAPR